MSAKVSTQQQREIKAKIPNNIRAVLKDQIKVLVEQAARARINQPGFFDKALQEAVDDYVAKVRAENMLASKPKEGETVAKKKTNIFHKRNTSKHQENIVVDFQALKKSSNGIQSAEIQLPASSYKVEEPADLQPQVASHGQPEVSIPKPYAKYEAFEDD